MKRWFILSAARIVIRESSRFASQSKTSWARSATIPGRYRMTILAEVPEPLEITDLEKALDEAGASIGVDVRLTSA